MNGHYLQKKHERPLALTCLPLQGGRFSVRNNDKLDVGCAWSLIPDYLGALAAQLPHAHTLLAIRLLMMIIFSQIHLREGESYTVSVCMLCVSR